MNEKDNTLELYKNIFLPHGYRWKKGLVSLIYKGNIFLYNTLTGAYIRVINFNKIYKNKKPIFINNNELINKLESLSLITKQNKNEEEINYFKFLNSLQQKSKTLNYTIAPTLNCNLRCNYCFVKKGSILMSDENADFLGNYIKDKYYQTGKDINITWYGGEPLLAINLINKISLFLIKNKVRFFSNIVSNGLLINHEIINYLQYSNVSEIQLTLDGYKIDHNITRNFYNNKLDTYSIILKSAELLISNNFNLKIRINCSSDNISNIPKILECKNFLKLDKSKFTIYFETIDKYYKGFLIYLKLKRLIKLFSDAGYKVLDNFSRKSLYFSCSAFRNDDYCIGPKLELYDCYSDFGNKNRVIGILGSSNVIKSFYTSINVLPVICRDCPVLAFCYAGGCPYKLIHGNFVYDKLFCKDFKKIIYNKLVMRLCNKYEN